MCSAKWPTLKSMRALGGIWRCRSRNPATSGAVLAAMIWLPLAVFFFFTIIIVKIFTTDIWKSRISKSFLKKTEIFKKISGKIMKSENFAGIFRKKRWKLQKCVHFGRLKFPENMIQKLSLQRKVVKKHCVEGMVATRLHEIPWMTESGTLIWQYIFCVEHDVRRELSWRSDTRC